MDDNVLICYVRGTDGENYRRFKEQCRDKNANDTQWILVSNVGNHSDDNLSLLSQISNYEESKVQGFIMMATRLPRLLNQTEEKYKSPKVISIVSIANGEPYKIQKYAWNTQNIHTKPDFI